jgi:xanthine dehydrogenase accessory factor
MTDAALRALARRWADAATPAWIVKVIDTQGSVPRHTGTRMLVGGEDAAPPGAPRVASTIAGTIGGGHLEWKAIDHAQRLLRGEPLPTSLRLPLGPALGQCCGGVVTLGFEPLTPLALERWQTPAPLFSAQLYGAGHVGRAIARALEPLDVQVQWIDERESEFPAESSPAHIRRVAVDAVEGEVATAPPGAFYLVLTHSHDLDLRITEAILRRGDFGFLGLIGSLTKRARFLHRFEERGLAPEVLARLTCPIGLPGISGKEPAVIAASVAAQLLQVADGRSRVELP